MTLEELIIALQEKQEEIETYCSHWGCPSTSDCHCGRCSDLEAILKEVGVI